MLCTPAAAPRMKPYLERVFCIMATTPMPRLTGRMVSNMIARGDQAPERAAPNADEFCTAMRRWIVAVYHPTTAYPRTGSAARERLMAGGASWHTLAIIRRRICGAAA